MANASGHNQANVRKQDGTWEVNGTLDIKTANGGVLKIDGTDVSAGLQEVANLNGLSSDEVAFIDGAVAGTVAAGKAVVATTGKVVDELDITLLKVGGVNMTAAISELAAKAIGTATFGTLTAESGEARTQSIQLKDFAGADLAVKAAVKVYVSTDSAGLEPGDGNATITLTAGTDGALISADESGAMFVSEADGDLDITLTDGAGATQTVYLNVITPLGEVISSGAIAFAA